MLKKYYLFAVILAVMLVYLAGCAKEDQKILPTATRQNERSPIEAGAETKETDEDKIANLPSLPETNEKSPELAKPAPKTITVSGEINLPVAFASQAPFANWILPYEEACEEASAIMAAKYFKKEPLNNEIMDSEILKLVDWETNYFGYYEDTTAAETVEILKKYFELNAYLSAEVTAERIKEELNAGNLIIIPAAGQTLGNPYFSGDGPPYHMLIIRGYNDNEFITNDPGTWRGENYKYKYNTLINATHDWTGHKDTIKEGRKVMIVVTENLK